MNNYVREYKAAKTERAGAFSSIREKIAGLTSRIAGGAQKDVGSIEV